MLLDELCKNDKFVIFGAQVVGYGAYVAIKELCGKIPEAFVVSDLNRYLQIHEDAEKNIAKNPDNIEGIPVRNVDDYENNTLIVVAVSELVQKEVVPQLQVKGYNNLFLLGGHEEHLLMREYFDHINMFPELKGCYEEDDIDNGIDLALYEVHNCKDKELQSKKSGLRPYEYEIQAGAETADRIIAEICDNVGNHISERNHKYCEMTATYYVWKNTNHAWKGIEHYRRHLLVSTGMIARDKSNVDAVLPLPYVCYPNARAQASRFISESVFELLHEALRTLHPEDYNSYQKIMDNRYQYTYNLVCARKDVFDNYCKWFFEITEYMENKENVVPEIKNTRALSYVAEVLTNIYFMHHGKDLLIKHVEKKIYI